MPWYVRKSVKMGPVRLNLSKRGLGMSVGVRGLRIGTGPRGPYVAGGRGGVYFRQSLAQKRRPASVRQPVRRAALVPAPAPVPAPLPFAAPPPPPPVPPYGSASHYAPTPQPYTTPPPAGPVESYRQPYQQPFTAPQPYGPIPPGPIPPASAAPARPFPAQAPYQLPYQFSAPPRVPPPPRTYHSFSDTFGTVLLASLSAAQTLAWTFMFADSATQPTPPPGGSSSFGPLGDTGMWLLLTSLVGVCIADWHGFISLRGRIPWWRLSSGQKFWLVCAYIFAFEIMAPIYLVGAWIDWQRARAQEPLQRRLHTAQMEAQLGYVPVTEGTCRSCGKPLQVGAEFCAYCRAPVAEHAKVCLHCGGAAAPDARWCPRCGEALP